jgi:hypothetical protein
MNWNDNFVVWLKPLASMVFHPSHEHGYRACSTLRENAAMFDRIIVVAVKARLRHRRRLGYWTG